MRSADTEGVDPGGFKNRKTGLMIFGVLTVLLGGLCALFVPLMLFGHKLAEQTGSPQNLQTILPSVFVYAILAVALVWLGIGSIMARRWARALLLIFSWTWLVTGVIAMIATAFIMPQIMESTLTQAGPPPGGEEMPAWAGSLLIVLPMIILCVIFLIMPLAWMLFYRSKHVKATCEFFDQVERWTDRCPLPVLGVCLLLAYSAPMMFLMPFAFNGVVPFFGTFLSGSAGSIASILLGLLWFYLTWALYRLNPRGWWIAFGTFTLISISAVITYLQNDILEFYALMGYPAEQIDQLEQFSFTNDSTMVAITAVSCTLWLVYLIYLKRFFPPGRPETEADPV